MLGRILQTAYSLSFLTTVLPKLMRAISLLGIVLCLQACALKPVIDDSKEDIAIKQFIQAEKLSYEDDLHFTFGSSAYESDETLAWWYLSDKFGAVWSSRIPVSASYKRLLEIGGECSSLLEAERVILLKRTLLKTPSKTRISPENNLKQRCTVRRAYRINNPQLRNLIHLGQRDISDKN